MDVAPLHMKLQRPRHRKNVLHGAGARVFCKQPGEQNGLVDGETAHRLRVQLRDLQCDRSAVGVTDQVNASGGAQDRLDEPHLVGQRQRLRTDPGRLCAVAMEVDGVHVEPDTEALDERVPLA